MKITLTESIEYNVDIDIAITNEEHIAALEDLIVDFIEGYAPVPYTIETAISTKELQEDVITLVKEFGYKADAVQVTVAKVPTQYFTILEVEHETD